MVYALRVFAYGFCAFMPYYTFHNGKFPIMTIEPMMGQEWQLRTKRMHFRKGLTSD